MGIRFTSDTLTPGIKRAPQAFSKGMEGLMARWEPQVQGHAQRTAPWNDQTGNARQGLAAKRFHTKDTYGIDLFHRMPYGIWLEVRWSGRYAVIMPTINIMAARIMAEAPRVLRNL